MPAKPVKTSTKVINILALSVCIIAGFFLIKSFVSEKKQLPVETKQETASKQPITAREIIDYGKVGKDEPVTALMEKRKEKYGVQDSIDMVLRQDEAVRIGEKTVSIRDILDKGKLKAGRFIETDIDTGRSTVENITADYGIHVVQPGDNIWNIHFSLLKEFFSKKGVTVSPLADEPAASGYSSGIGRLLKFSEQAVYIYNLKTGNLDVDLSIIEPLSKIVMYNMTEVFDLLEQIDYSNVNDIRFDGETIWIPAD